MMARAVKWKTRLSDRAAFFERNPPMPVLARGMRSLREVGRGSATTGVTTMKITSRRICGALLGLCVLSVIVRGAGADEMAAWMAEMQRQNDEFHRKAQEDREAMDRFNREAYAEREARDKYWREVYEQRDAADKAYREEQAAREAQDRANYEAQQQRDAWDKYYREVQEARDAQDKANYEAQQQRDAWDRWNREAQEWRDSQQKQQEWDDWMNRGQGSAEAGGLGAGPTSTRPQAPLARLRPVPQVRSFVPAAPRPRPMPQNAIAFQQMVRQHQARVRQQILQAQQQMLHGRQEYGPLVMQNPFVSSSPMQGRQESSGPLMSQNPFVDSSP
jgi:hypothetical protein